ncbi:MAG TPA: RNA polymerase factor sigma-54 [Planctomycetota bacterium]|nr:RNA polymerase factor sigma-54 [Planctomycetota bacterium]
MGMDVRMGLGLGLGQRLDLRLAPQIIQSIELLQLPSLDLLDMIQQELDVNEFLEAAPRTDAPAEDGRAAKIEAERAREEGVAVKESEAPAEEYAGAEELDGWQDMADRRPRSSDEDPGADKIEAMNNTASAGATLQESVLEQFKLLPEAEKYLPLAEQIAFNLDDRGYLACPLEEAVRPHSDRYTAEDAERALTLVQGLEPRGVGARTPEECLLLQLDPSHPRYEEQRTLLERHYDDLRKNRLPQIARKMNLEVDELKDLLRTLSHLTLRPTLRRVEERNRYIRPDVIVDWSADGYEVRLANEYIPELRLAPEYKLALQAKAAGKDYRDYVKKKVDSARAFIMAVEKRQKTLLEVAKRIVHYQREFLDYGPHYLRPLKMQEVATDLGIHVSTVSRAASGKYMQTHRGIFALKDFFTGGTQGLDGEVESRQSVKQKVKELCDAEDKANPLSDDDIVEKLRSIHGVEVARRTVTKYRKALGIASSRQRRTF